MSDLIELQFELRDLLNNDLGVPIAAANRVAALGPPRVAADPIAEPGAAAVLDPAIALDEGAAT